MRKLTDSYNAKNYTVEYLQDKYNILVNNQLDRKTISDFFLVVDEYITI